MSNCLTANSLVSMSQFIEMFGACTHNVSLSTLCNVFIDGDWIESKDQSDVGIRLIQTGNIGDGYFRDKDDKARYISEQTFEHLKCTEVFPNDILISRLPDPIGRACVIPDGIGKSITAVDCTIVRLSDKILPEFFVAYTKTPMYQRQINEVATGTTRRRVSRANLGNIRITCPSLDKQQQFVDIVNQADKSKFVGFKSQFIEMFGDYEMTVNFGDLLSSVRNGANIKQGVISGGIPITRIETISEGEVNRDKMGYAGIVDNTYSSYYLQDGDILVSHINSIKHIGKCALYQRINDETIIHGMNLLCLRPYKDIVHPQYLTYLLRSSIMRKFILDITKPAVNQASFTVKDLCKLKVMLPPISEQEEFVAIVKQADKSKYFS